VILKVYPSEHYFNVPKVRNNQRQLIIIEIANYQLASITNMFLTGTTIATVAATDPDSSSHSHGRLVYSILSGDTNNQFQIDPSTAIVTLAGEMDRETVGSSTIEIVIKVNN
jgi:hypothetical protein